MTLKLKTLKDINNTKITTCFSPYKVPSHNITSTESTEKENKIVNSEVATFVIYIFSLSKKLYSQHLQTKIHTEIEY